MTISTLYLFGLAFDIITFATLPLYILVLVTLIKFRKHETLKHSFFTLMISIGIADIGTILEVVWRRVALYGWIPQLYIRVGGFASQISSIIHFFCGTAEAIGVFAVAVNRFTAYVMPTRHQKIWNGGNILRNVIIFSWIASFISVIPLFFIPFEIHVVPPENMTVWFWFKNANDQLFYQLPLTFTTKPLLITIIMVLYGIVFVLALSRKCSQRGTTPAETAALKMAIVGFLSSVGLVIYLIAYIWCNLDWVLYKKDWDVDVYWFWSNLGSALFAGINPYVLLIFSAATRKRFCQMYFCNCKINRLLRRTVPIVPD